MNQTGHSEHCRRCKERVRELLAALYGDCYANHSFFWSSMPQDYSDSPIGDALAKIRDGLGAIRGHRNFIKSAQVPPCDFYLPNQKLIVEFDESQHFTRPRLVALSLYPDDLKYGFSLERWKELCRQIDAQDDTPFDRDERRAWYDMLRDLVPTLYSFKPTVRLYAEDFAWCSLDGAAVKDQEVFHSALKGQVPVS